MTGPELIKFLTLLYQTGGLNAYWRGRVRAAIEKFGGRVE
jgi:hypothetical protein